MKHRTIQISATTVSVLMNNKLYTNPTVSHTTKKPFRIAARDFLTRFDWLNTFLYSYVKNKIRRKQTIQAKVNDCVFLYRWKG